MNPQATDHILHYQGERHDLTLHLTPERAAYWPAKRTLFVADMHLGKAAVFRARGVPVPQGTTTATLARLSQVMTRLQTRHVVVLGDFLHARESHAKPTLSALHEWRLRHATVNCTVVRGNHDRHAGDVAASLGFEPVVGPYAEAGLIGVHEEKEAWPHVVTGEHAGGLVLTGHVHPVADLRNRLDHLRLPCYFLAQRTWPGKDAGAPSSRTSVLTLPAFGEFTGGYAVDHRAPGSKAFVIGGGLVQAFGGAPEA